MITYSAAETIGNPVANMAIFGVFVLVTLFVVIRASKRNATADEFFTGGRAFSGPQNGIAIAGDYLSAASFLGIAGAIAVYGYDGFLYSIGFLVAWLVALLLVAELLRSTGKFTMADVLSFRLKQKPVRLAAAISTMTVSLFYLLAQMAGAGGLVALLLDVKSHSGQSIVIAVVGILMIVYVLVGGMKGTTWVQIIKAVLLIAGAALMTAWVFSKYGFSLSNLMGAAADNSPLGDKLLSAGAKYGKTTMTKIDFISLSMALVLGTAGLPHVLMRFYTVPTSKEARKSVVWAISLIGLFYLFSLVLGFGAAALVGADVIAKAPGGANSAAPLLAYELGGTLLLGFISAVAFATILAVVAGLTITASASFAHDIYNSYIKRGQVSADAEVKVARIAAVVIGVFAIIGGILAKDQNIAFLVALAFAVAASSNLPAVFLTLYWKRANTYGIVAGMVVGAVTAIALVMISPNMTYPKAVLKEADKVLNGEPAQPAKEAVPAQAASSFMCELFAMEGCVASAPAKAAATEKPAKPGAAEKLATLNAKLATLSDEKDIAAVKKDIAATEKAKAKAEGDLKKFEGQTTSMMGLEKPYFLLKNPGLISIPLGFLVVILGSLLFRDKRSEEMWDELYVRQNTGIHAEGATAH